METETLHISISSQQEVDQGTASTSWSFQSDIFQYSWGLSEACTHYRIVLKGLLTALYILFKVESNTENTMYPTVIIQCAHKKAMREAFCQSPLGATTANQINYDLILDIRYSQNLLRSTIQTSCNQTPAMETSHPIQTPMLSAAFITDPTFNNYISALDSTPMSHVITVLHNDTVLIGDIRTINQDFEYSQPIREKLRKDNSWTDDQINMVDWDSFYIAMQKIPRSHCISIMKLSHQLWNTNIQNNKYYNQIASCPMCGHSLETASHIFKCPRPGATATPQGALHGLSTSLQGGTPPIILEAIISGLQQRESTDCPSMIKASAAGSRLPSLQAITLAFDQQTSMGWDSFHRGHVTSAWREAFSQHSRPK